MGQSWKPKPWSIKYEYGINNHIDVIENEATKQKSWIYLKL